MAKHHHPLEHNPGKVPAKAGSGEHGHHDHHAHMAADFRKRFWISLVLTLPILVLSPMLQSLVRSNPLDVVAIVQLSRATYRKMIQNLLWATGYNVVAIPLAAGALYAWGVVLTPAVGAVLMAGSTVVVAINARMLRLKK